jgi:signal transduction histidine kinase
MPILGVFLIYAAVVLRAVVVLADRPGFALVSALLAMYGLLLTGKTWLEHRTRAPRLASPFLQLAYLCLQSILVIGILISSTYEDFLAMLFIPLSLDAVAFFGRRMGFASIAILALAMTLTLWFSDAGWLFGLVMGILYSGLCFLFGGYADQVIKAGSAHAQNKQMLKQLEAAHRQLQGYARQKASLAVEHERNHLARELHDSVTQTVFSMNLAAQSAELLLEREPARAAGQLLRIEDLAASALREIQSLVSQLKPASIPQESLPAALRRLAAEKKREGLRVALEIQGERPLPRLITTSLYEIAQEALVNVSKHSGVCEAIVRLTVDPGRYCLEIEDHGRGFDPETALAPHEHFGLAGITERTREIGWHLSIFSKPGQGTRICVTEQPSGDGQ